MSGQRYFAFIADDDAAMSIWRTRLAEHATAIDGLASTLDHGRCLLFAQSAVETPGPSIAIVGDLIRRDASELAHTLTDSEADLISASRGRSLIDRFWGGYVAILARAEGVDVIRAPMGDLACYRLAVAGGTMIASDINLLITLAGYVPGISWTAVSDTLLAPDLRRDATCLAGVTELTGGQRLTVGSSTVIDTLWTPWTCVPERGQPAPSPDTLRRTVCASVAARAARDDRSILLLSGGLDSSIVAAAAARWRCRAHGLTMVTNDRAGDERDYARLTADHVGMPLADRVRDTALVDVERSSAAGLPYPAARSFAQATEAAARALATEIGATAILHGGGGDHVFCSIQSAAPVTDLLRRGRFGPTLWRTAHSLATLAQATTFAVYRQAVARLARRGPLVRLRATVDFLSGDIHHRAADALRHFWLDAPLGALPGSAAHVVNILYALSVVQSPDARAALPSRAVLLGQPIVEACLAIPSWCWLDDGHNRAFARHAFATMLPNEVVWRRSKGVLNGFMVELFEQNRIRLRPFLLDGLLAANGLLDRLSLEAALDRRGPVKGDDYGRILELADVEAWLRSWPGG